MLKLFRNSISIFTNSYFQLFFLLIILSLSSCLIQPQSESISMITNQTWKSQDPISINLSFEKDSSAPYQIYFTIKHTDDFHYKNIWIRLYIENIDLKSQDSLMYELPLATDQQGWLGTEFDKVILHKILLNVQPYYFLKGHYKISVKQWMRENPLENVISVGLLFKKINTQ